jgi:predicted SprT family Zn-dependent metalloprotease
LERFKINNVTFSIKENSFLAKIATWKLRSDNVAMVLGNTIHLYGVTTQEFLSNDKWIKHELCHIKQYKQHGFIGFLVKYLWESIKVGYYKNKFEVEAREAEIA